VGVAGAESLENGAEGEVEEVIDLEVGVGVGPAHEAVADQPDVQRFRHGAVPWVVRSRVFQRFVKWLYTSRATRAHKTLPALSRSQRRSALSAVSTHSTTGPSSR